MLLRRERDREGGNDGDSIPLVSRISAAMFRIQDFSNRFPPNYYRHALIVAFAVAGFSKLIPAVRNIMQKHFNFMAPWTWNTIAVWEIGLGVIYHFLGFKAFALNMAFMLLGGALWATNFQSKRHYPVSILRQTYGVALLPVSCLPLFLFIYLFIFTIFYLFVAAAVLLFTDFLCSIS